jgi:23S rRNA (uracil1939-C5)-methyltransferase
VTDALATAPVELELAPTGVAAGGDGLARDGEGRVAFVEGAIPGDRVRAMVTEARRDFVRTRTVEVLDPSPQRVEPPCPFARAGCGGCQWQHVAVPAQLELKTAVVVDALRRIAHVDPAPVRAGGAVADRGYRTTVRLAVDADGRPSYRRRHGHELVAVDSCLIAHPALEELIVEGRFPGARDVTLRISVATGERIAIPRPASAGAVVPGDVLIGGRLHEEVAGMPWRVSGGSFFQDGPAAAELLVDAVRAAAGDALDRGGILVDAYAGVGLLGGVLAAGRDGVELIAIESHPTAGRDAQANLRRLGAHVVRADVSPWRAPDEPVALAVADPARPGLGRPGVQALAAARPEVLVLVSCDPASLGRDTALLRDAGYDLASVTVLDLFPHTFHVETVSRFERRARAV